jgi:serine/threonine-protein kinase
VALTSGTRIGAYEITGQLGAGGMGEVYRAIDTVLKRQVALKVLPPEVANDTERIARFQREAEVLASLNHPNIAHLYGIERSNGALALVMELVEGETLADRIAKGPMSLDEALPIAKQIADALETAHEQNIIHRDLKPANIKVRDDGTVKVLDFGLAKALEPITATGMSAAAVTNSPTITSPALITGAGVLLGTAAYMSPEQAKGKPAATQSDMWAFGSVLYEMLTGRRAFAGDDVADTLAAVLRGEPDWSALPSQTPVFVVTLLKTCLEKDSRRRTANSAAARFILAQSALPASVQSPQPPLPTRVGRRFYLTVAGAALLSALVAGVAVWTLKPAAADSGTAVVRFSHTLGSGDTFSGVTRQLLDIAPDGTELVYSANGQLYRRRIDDVESVPIAGTNLGEGAYQPVYSPDGRWIAFYSPVDGTLKRVSPNGGSLSTLTQTTNPTGMSWGAAGLVFARANRGSQGIFLLGSEGGEPKLLVELGASEFAFRPSILPGGDAVLFTVGRTELGMPRWETAAIVVQSIRSGERRVVLEKASDARYVSSGHLLYANSGTVFAVRFDPATGSTRGEPVPVLVGVRRSLTYNSAAAQFAVSEGGSLVYIPGPANASSADYALVVSDQSGRSTSLKLPAQYYVHPRVSGDGSRLAVEIDEGSEASIWVYGLAETAAIRRLTLKGHNRYPVWSSDGQRVAFQSDAGATPGIFWQRADGVGQSERLTTAPERIEQIPDSFSPTGKELLFSEWNGRTHVLKVLSMATKAIAPFGDVQSAQPIEAEFSPDGHWVAYSVATAPGGQRSQDRGVFVQPFPPQGTIIPAPRVRVDFHPAWTGKGDGILYVASTAVPMVMAPVSTQPSFTFGAPVRMPYPIPQALSEETRAYDPLPDGRVLLVVPAQVSSDAAARPEIRVVVNWVEELHRKVPVPHD